MRCCSSKIFLRSIQNHTLFIELNRVKCYSCTPSVLTRSSLLHLPNDLRLAPFHVSGIDGANSTIQDKGIIVSTCVRKEIETSTDTPTSFEPAESLLNILSRIDQRSLLLPKWRQQVSLGSDMLYITWWQTALSKWPMSRLFSQYDHSLLPESIKLCFQQESRQNSRSSWTKTNFKAKWFGLERSLIYFIFRISRPMWDFIIQCCHISIQFYTLPYIDVGFASFSFSFQVRSDKWNLKKWTKYPSFHFHFHRW